HLAAIRVDRLAEDQAGAMNDILAFVARKLEFNSQRSVTEFPFGDVDFVRRSAYENAVAAQLPRTRPTAGPGPVAQLATEQILPGIFGVGGGRRPAEHAGRETDSEDGQNSAHRGSGRHL